MITTLTKDKNSVELDESFTESAAFGIADAAKAFHAITTQIYKNPEYSVIAEICANAWDSHILAKKTTEPFNIHLPNRFEPWFSVRDFGVSMSHEFMLQKYSQAFLSTKDNTNKQNGAFGIGRLTCLALNDTYNAICYLDGVKRTYSIYKEDSVPKITLLSTEDSEERNGFEVSVNVPNNYNYDTFAENAGKILAFYPIKMNVSGCADFTYSLPEYDLRINDSGLNFGFPKDKSSFVVMGVYSYPIDIYSIDELSDKERRVLKNGIHLFAKLGDCSVNLSRDGLFYDKKTKQCIKHAIVKIAEKYIEVITKKIENAPNYFEALKLYWSNFSYNGDCYDLTDKGQKTPSINWNGITISGFDFILPANSKVKMQYASVDGSNKVYLSDVSKFAIQSKQKFIINDLDKKTGIKIRIKTLHESSYNYEYVIFDNVDKDFLDTYKLKESDFISLKSIIPLKSGRTYNYDRAKCKIFEYGPQKNGRYYSHSQKSSNWSVPENFDEEDLDTAEGCYIYLEDRFNLPESHYHYFSNLRSIFTLFKHYDPTFVEPTIYGVRYSVSSEIKQKVADNLTPLIEFIQKKATDIILKSEFNAKLHTFESDFSNTKCRKDGYFGSFIDFCNNYIFGEIPAARYFVDLKDKLNEKLKNSSFTKISELAKICNINVNAIKSDETANFEIKSDICDTIQEVYNLLQEKYGVFNQLTFYYSYYSNEKQKVKESIQKVIDMIHATDGKIVLDETKINGILEKVNQEIKENNSTKTEE